MQRSRLGLWLAAAIALLALGVHETRADSLAACKTRCEVGADHCRAPKEPMLDGCTGLYDCGTPACESDGECRFGCARCHSMWNYPLEDCDRKRNECNARCDAGEDAR